MSCTPRSSCCSFCVSTPTPLSLLPRFRKNRRFRRCFQNENDFNRKGDKGRFFPPLSSASVGAQNNNFKKGDDDEEDGFDDDSVKRRRAETNDKDTVKRRK